MRRHIKNERSVVFMKRRVHSLDNSDQRMMTQVSFSIENSKQKLLNNQHANMAINEMSQTQQIISPKKLMQTQEQFLAVQPIEYGMISVTPQQLSKNLLKFGQDIKNSTIQDVYQLTSYKNSLSSSKEKLIERNNPKFLHQKMKEHLNAKKKTEGLSQYSKESTNRDNQQQHAATQKVLADTIQKLTQNIDKKEITKQIHISQSPRNIKSQPLLQNKSTQDKPFLSYHQTCEQLEQLQLNKALEQLLNKEIKMKDFLSAKIQHEKFKQERTPQNMHSKNKILSPLLVKKEPKPQNFANENKFLFDHFVVLCKEQINKGYLKVESGMLEFDNEDFKNDKEKEEFNRIILKKKTLELQEEAKKIEKEMNEIQNEFDRDFCKEYFNKYLHKSMIEKPLQVNNEPEHVDENRKNLNLINNISETLKQVVEIRNNISKKVDQEENQEEVKLRDVLEKQVKEGTKVLKKLKKERERQIKQIEVTKIETKDIRNGFDEILEQVAQWSKDRSKLLKNLWKAYQAQLTYQVKKYLNQQKSFNYELIKIADESLTTLELNTTQLINTIKDFKITEDQHKRLRTVFQKCANLYHQEEEKNKDLNQRFHKLEKKIQIWLPNINEYSKSKDLVDLLQIHTGIGKMWGKDYKNINDEDIRDSILEKMTTDQLWLKGDLERLIQNGQIFTNDKIECERLTRDLVKANKKILKKQVQIKQFKLDKEKLEIQIEKLLEELSASKQFNNDYLELKRKVQRYEKVEKKDKMIACDLGGLGGIPTLAIHEHHSNASSSAHHRQMSVKNLYYQDLPSPGSSKGLMKMVNIDNIMSKVLQTQEKFNKTLAVDNSKNQTILGVSNINSSPGNSRKTSFKMNRLEELVHEPIPVAHKEKAQNLLNLMSSIMTKLAIQPFRHMKDLFIEELLTNNSPKKAGELAEEFFKIIIDISGKDSRIKLLKLFIGFGEQNAYTQPVSQNFVELISNTQLPFDDIFTGEIQSMQVELENAVANIKQQIKLQSDQHITKQILEKSINGIIRQAKVTLNGVEQQLDQDLESIQNYRYIKQIIKREKQQKLEEPFMNLLKKCESKVTIEQFYEYLVKTLCIDPQEYVSDYQQFYVKVLDKSQRGYITGYELQNLFEMELEIEVSLLNFIKESLNGIVELDNQLNYELEKVFWKFESFHQFGKGLSLQGLKESFKFLVNGFPPNQQGECEKRRKEAYDIFERRKIKKYVELEEFLQACKDFQMFENLEKLIDHNSRNLQKYQIIQKGSSQALNVGPGGGLPKGSHQLMPSLQGAIRKSLDNGNKIKSKLSSSNVTGDSSNDYKVLVHNIHEQDSNTNYLNASNQKVKLRRKSVLKQPKVSKKNVRQASFRKKKVMTVEENILSSPMIDKDDPIEKQTNELQVIDSSRDQDQDEDEQEDQQLQVQPMPSQGIISERTLSEDIDFGQNNLESRIKHYENTIEELLTENLQKEAINEFNNEGEDQSMKSYGDEEQKQNENGDSSDDSIRDLSNAINQRPLVSKDISENAYLNKLPKLDSRRVSKQQSTEDFVKMFSKNKSKIAKLIQSNFKTSSQSQSSSHSFQSPAMLRKPSPLQMQNIENLAIQGKQI